jgi:hypothetical protein
MNIRTYRHILGCQRTLTYIPQHTDDPEVRRSVNLAINYLLPAVSVAEAWFASDDGQAALRDYTDARVRRAMRRRRAALRRKISMIQAGSYITPAERRKLVRLSRSLKGRSNGR